MASQLVGRSNRSVTLVHFSESIHSLQVSLRESKDGSEAKLEAAKIFSRVIAAGLHRIASAMAKDSECITKASKVSALFEFCDIKCKLMCASASEFSGSEAVCS